MRGTDTGTIRELLGHTSERMTQRYAHASETHLHRAVQRLERNPESPNEVAPLVAPALADDGGSRTRERVSSRVSR